MSHTDALRQLCTQLLEELALRVSDRSDSSLPELENRALSLGVDVCIPGSSKASGPSKPRYFIRESDRGPGFREVSLEAWCNFEQRCGFRAKPGCGPAATGGFSGNCGDVSIEGTIRY